MSIKNEQNIKCCTFSVHIPLKAIRKSVPLENILIKYNITHPKYFVCIAINSCTNCTEPSILKHICRILHFIQTYFSWIGNNIELQKTGTAIWNVSHFYFKNKWWNFETKQILYYTYKIPENYYYCSVYLFMSMPKGKFPYMYWIYLNRNKKISNIRNSKNVTISWYVCFLYLTL